MQNCTVIALGRIGQLGDFYDVKTDTFVSGINIFSTRPPQSSVTSIDNFNTDLKYIEGDSYNDKCHHLDVSAELKLSVLAGLFQLSGSGKYLNDRKSTSRVSSCTVLYNVKTLLEKINIFDPKLKPLMCPDAVTAASDSGATHLVTELQYGANAMVTFESKSVDSSDSTHVEGMLSAELHKLSLSISGKAQVDYKEHDLQKVHNASFKVYGDILSDDDIPQNFHQALAYIRGVPTKARAANSGRGTPLSYGLFPIDMVKMYLQLAFTQQKIINSISQSTIQNFVMLFESIAKMKQQLLCFQQDAEEFRHVACYPDKVSIARLVNEIQQYEYELKHELKSTTVNVRSTVGESTLLEELFAKFQKDPRSPSSNRQRLIELERSLNEVIAFAKLMQQDGVQFIAPLDSLDNVLLAHQDTDIYVLFMNRQLKQVHGSDWDTNRRLFVALCRNARKMASTDIFYIQDSSSLENSSLYFHKVHISHFRNAKEISQDLTTSNVVNQTPVAKPSGIMQLRPKPNTRVGVELPCPGAFTGNCNNAPLVWYCSKCSQVLEYGFDQHFYCNCGKHSAHGYMYKCTDLENHGLGFEVYDHAVLTTFLENFRPLKEINILILGETGVGKSTWINGFVNYLTYPSLREAAAGEDVNLIPSSFMLTDSSGKSVNVKSKVKNKNENESTVMGESATQLPQSYVFPHGDSLIRIIDTPGIADTRGVAQDKKNFEHIMHHISHLREIHGICILLKPQESRTNVLFQFCIKELLTQLHRDAAKNIAFCFTNARSNFYRPGNTKQTLEAILAQNHEIDLTLSEHTMYCVDNESVRFLAAAQSGVTFTEDETAIYEGSWQKSVTETNRLLEHINGLPPHQTKSTISLNRARNLVLALTEPIGHIAKNIEMNIEAAEQHKEDIRLSLTQKEGYKKDLHIPKIDLVEEEIDYPTTVCSAPKCTKSHRNIGDDKVITEYTQRCHERCGLTVSKGTYPEVGLLNCWAMIGVNCRMCGCRWEKHLHITYKLKQVQTSVINHSVEQLLKATENRVEKVKLVLQQTEERITALKAERAMIADVSSKFAGFLKANAITPYNDALINYLEHLIRLEEAKIENGGHTRELVGLQDMLQTYQEKVRILDAALGTANQVILEPSEIESQIQILYNLPTQGETLKRLVEIVSNAANRTMVFNEQTYVPKQGYGRAKTLVVGPLGKKKPWYRMLLGKD